MSIIFCLIFGPIIGHFVHEPKTLCFIGIAWAFIVIYYIQGTLEADINKKIDRLHDRIDKLERR